MHLSVTGVEEGPQVLLLHGGGVGGWMWDAVRSQLDDTFRVIIPDLPGHDRSADVPYVSHTAATTELVSLIEREADGPVTVVGFSLGAQLAVLLAAEHPDLVDAVVVVSAQTEPLRFPGATLSLLGAAAPLARRSWFARLQARELFIPEESMDDYLRTSAGITRETLLASVGQNIGFVPPAGWASFPGTALVVVGARERPLMLRSAERLHEALEGSALEVVEGCGHGIPLQKPQWLAKRIREVSSQ